MAGYDVFVEKIVLKWYVCDQAVLIYSILIPVLVLNFALLHLYRG